MLQYDILQAHFFSFKIVTLKEKMIVIGFLFNVSLDL